MAKINYKFEKRARELAKKQKKEEKLLRRQENAAKAKAAENGETAEGQVPNDDSLSPSSET